MSKIPRVIDIPSKLRAEIANKAAGIWAPKQIANFSCMQIQTFQDEIKIIKTSLMDALGEDDSQVDKIHKDTLIIEYVDGTQKEIPQEKSQIVQQKFDEIAKIEEMVELSGYMCVGIQKKSVINHNEMMQMISSALPIINNGEWRVDLNNMKVIEILPEEETSESNTDIDKQ